MVRSKALRRYCREIRKELPGGRNMRRLVLGKLTAAVEEYLKEKPDAGYDELVMRFGDPKTIAASCVEEMDTTEILCTIALRKRILTVATAAALVALLLWASVVGIAYMKNQNRSNGYFTEQIVNVVSDQGIKGE